MALPNITFNGLSHPWGPYSGFELTKRIHTDITNATDPTQVQLAAGFTVAVTGSGHGIGEAIATSYVRAGASNVVIISRTASDLDDVEKRLLLLNSKLRVLKAVVDVTSEPDIQSLAHSIQCEFGRLDVLVNNVGTGPRGLTPGFMVDSTEDFRRVLDTNVWSTYLATHYLLPLIVNSKDGAQAIINISSVAIHTILPLSVSYILTKGTIAKMAELVHEAHNPDGVVCYAVHPGAVKTGHNDDEPDAVLDMMTDTLELCGGFLVWLTKIKRDWLSGRYISVTWDVEELEEMMHSVQEQDKFKLRMAI